MHRDKIAVEYRIDDQLAEAGDREDRFRNDQAPEEPGDNQAARRDDGNQGVFQRMAENDQPFFQSLRISGANVVGLKRFQQTAAHHPHENGRFTQAGGDDGQDHRGEISQGIIKKWNVTGCRHPAQLDGEQNNQHHAEPEMGNRHAAQGKQSARIIGQAARTHCGQDSGRNGDQGRDDKGAERQFDRGGQPLHDQLGNRGMVDERVAQIAVQDSGQPIEVLNREGLVQTQFSPESGHCFRGGFLAENDGCRITGEHVHQGEDHEGDEENDRDGEQQAPDDDGYVFPPLFFAEFRRTDQTVGNILKALHILRQAGHVMFVVEINIGNIFMHDFHDPVIYRFPL